jgi:Carbohydrate family 9 binding domain-like
MRDLNQGGNARPIVGIARPIVRLIVGNSRPVAFGAQRRHRSQRATASRFWRYGSSLSLLGVLAAGCAAQDENTDMGSAGSSNAGSSGSGAGGSAGTNAAGSGSAGTNANAGSLSGGAGGTASGGSAGKAGEANGGGAGTSGGAAGNAGSSGAAGNAGNAGSGGVGGVGGSAGAGGNAGSGGKGGAGGAGGAGGTAGSAGMSGGGSGGGSTCSVVTDCSAQFVCEASKCRPRGCNATNCAYDLTRFIIGTPIAASARGQVFVTWDATKLNLDFQILDKTAQNDSANNWEDDSVELYLDLNSAGAVTYDGNDFQLNIPRDAGTLVGIGPNLNFAAITVTRTENANGYQLKVSVPWNALNGATSQVGKTIGFDVAINDDRDGVARETQVMLYGFDQNYLNTSQFGDLTLTP